MTELLRKQPFFGSLVLRLPLRPDPTRETLATDGHEIRYSPQWVAETEAHLIEPGSHLTDLQHPWRRIRDRAGLDDVRIHDLRHSFASRALALGEGLPMIGKLLGHTQVQTTGPVRPPCPRYREGFRGAHRRQHRQRSRRCTISRSRFYGLYVY